jgi:hypothetical protein
MTEVFATVFILLFLILDIIETIDRDVTYNGIMDVRGLFRVGKVLYAIRKVTKFDKVFEKTKKDNKNKRETENFCMTSPVKRVNEIICHIKDLLPDSESVLREDIEYCLRIINSNKLYEPVWNFEKLESSPSKKGGQTV